MFSKKVFEKFGVLVISMAGGDDILKGLVGDPTFNF
jgi:hypothetical protein